MRTRHTGRAVLGAIILAVALPAGALTALAAPPDPLTDRPEDGASGAAAWLAASIDGDGLAVGPGGRPDPNTTRQTAMALALASSESAALTRALDALSDRLDVLSDSNGDDRPAALAELIITTVASGGDPTKVGPAGAETDLVARLVGTVRTDGPDAGLFGAQDPTFDGAYRQGLALAALAAAGRSAPAATAWLRTQRCDEGSWTAYRADPTAPCPPIDPGAFTGPDTNSTAFALIGLAATGDDVSDADAAWLVARRAADGGWAYLPSDGAVSDPNSTALVVSALDALGIDPDSVEGLSPRVVLTRFQFGCEAPAVDRGALWFPPFVEEDGYVSSALATAQALPALAGVNLARIGGADGSDRVAATLNCDDPPTTTTTTPQTTTTAPVTTLAPPTTTAVVTQVQGTSAVQATAAAPQSTSTVSYTG